jgi:hypothetical protein
LVFDLSAWRGRTFQLYFNVYNDGLGGMAQMYLDDVALVVCTGGSGGGGGGTGGGLVTPALPTGVPITPTRGACPNPILPCMAPKVTPTTASAVATPLPAQAAPVIIEPQAEPAIIEPQAAPAIIQPQVEPVIIQPAPVQQSPAIITVAPQQLETLAGETQPEVILPSILELPGTTAEVVPLPTGVAVLQTEGAAAIFAAGDDPVEPSVTQIALVVTAVPAAPVLVESTIVPELGNATPVPTNTPKAPATGTKTRITDKWPRFWWLIPIGFILIFVLIWFLARRRK